MFPKYRSEAAVEQILTQEEHTSKILNFIEEYKQDRPLGNHSPLFLRFSFFFNNTLVLTLYYFDRYTIDVVCI